MNEEKQESIIRVSGKGNVHVVPDVTRLEVTISGVFKTYEEAYAQARENSSWMVKILEYNHKSGKLAKTSRLDISDHYVNEYDDEGNYVDKVKDGFELDQRIKVDLAIDNILVNCIVRGIGKFIKGAQINIGYTVQDPRPYRLKVLGKAVQDATEKAKLMSEAVGCKLGQVRSIDYSDHGMHVYAEARNIHSNKEAMACSSDSLDITPDDLSMSEDVDVSWYMEQA